MNRSVIGKLVFGWLVSVCCLSLSNLRVNASETRNNVKPLATTEKGESLIRALKAGNQPPRILKGKPVFPTDFNWAEYSRTVKAITEVVNNAEEVFPSIVEHMTDEDYCITVSIYGQPINASVGEVCFRIARSWINRGYMGRMPEGSRPIVNYQAPFNMQALEFREWFREKYINMLLYELQIEAAEWSISIIPKTSKMPKVIQDLSIDSINKVISELRVKRKPIRGEFFDADTICAYSKDHPDRSGEAD